MGRCYEFGVAVHDGCEAPMTVVAEGGACSCSACGAFCGGRFAACAEVTATPGYVPVEIVAQPRQAAPAGAAPSPPATNGGAPNGVPAFDAGDALVAMRDLTDAFDRVGRELEAQRAARDEVLDALGELSGRVSRLEEAVSGRWPRLRGFRPAGQ